MKHPAPSVIFRSIGEEALDFELRCFVSDTDYYLPTLSGLNFAIDAALRQERIQPLSAPAISLQPQPTIEDLGLNRSVEIA
jgi:small-conductance mechanosensitive channel